MKKEMERKKIRRNKPDKTSRHQAGSKGAMKWLEENNALAGIIASMAIFIFYFGVISLANSFPHALSQFSLDWPWISLLSLGFGLQAYLHFRLRHELSKRALSAKGMAATGGVSGAAMVACCAHHISDALPFLGLAAAAGFLYDYRNLFMLFGVLSNFVGIAYILRMYSSHGISSGLPNAVSSLFGHENSFEISVLGTAAVFISYFLRFFVIR